ncbi:MAG: DNA-protecting protein DprA [Dehalococcoidales bacterium]|nr:DNA-protecting protein DprA [Dehalococcoidales bacterium]
MDNIISTNTQATLLITAPLITGRADGTADLFSLKEYNSLVRALSGMEREPGDLLGPESLDILNELSDKLDIDRIQTLLGRGFLLSQALEKWQTVSIWVISRGDTEYPSILKTNLKDSAPPLLYGCGDSSFLNDGGLAVVGSRKVDEELRAYTQAVGGLAAHSGYTVISGGAKGIDQAAMAGALQSGGKVIGVMADSLKRAVLSRDLREFLMNDRLVLVSPYDPSAGFNVGNAMQRNKVIYAFANAALVVSSDFQKGGTWTGAVEQLEKFKTIPVYVRPHSQTEKGLKGLHDKGAAVWPEPADTEEFENLMNNPDVSQDEPLQGTFDL